MKEMSVRTGSRLHFGLLSLPGEEVSDTGSPLNPDDTSLRPRSWGGAGLMVRHPGIEVAAGAQSGWFAPDPLGDRMLQVAERYLKSLGARASGKLMPPLFYLRQRAPEHQGLGTGTQLALAVGRLLAEVCGLGETGAEAIARRVGRGSRSAIGIHGFERGGFLIEAGKRQDEEISPLAARVPFPETWRILLILARESAGLHGPGEIGAFEQLRQVGHQALPTEKLCRLLLLEMLPALRQEDLHAFGEALFEFNRTVGVAFRAVQGGVYAHPRAETLVSFLRGQGVRGVGQSSWGPALFAIVGDADQARHLARQLESRFTLTAEELLVTEACNQGARVNRNDEER
jgi:beta-RFAP synthase